MRSVKVFFFCFLLHDILDTFMSAMSRDILKNINMENSRRSRLVARGQELPSAYLNTKDNAGIGQGLAKW